MSIRRKTLILVLGISLSTIFVVFFLTQSFLIDNFNKLENDKAVIGMERVENIFESQIDSMSILAADWANWDDTYEFVNNGNQDYITTNLTDQTFKGTGIDFILIADSSNRIFYTSTFSISEDKQVPPAPSLLSYFSEDSQLLKLPQGGEPVTGILMPSEGLPIAISAHAILTSDKVGPSRGTLVMGYYITPAVISKVSDISALNISMFSTQSKLQELQEVLPMVLASEGPYLKVENSSYMNSYTLVKDVFGNPAIVLKVLNPRDFYQESIKALSLLVGALMVIAVFSLVVSALFVNRIISKPMHFILEDVQKVGTGMNLSLRVRRSSTPEFQLLADNVNRMLDSLESSENILKEVNSVLGQKANELEKKTRELETMNKFMIGREVRMAELKKEIEALRNSMEKPKV